MLQRITKMVLRIIISAHRATRPLRAREYRSVKNIAAMSESVRKNRGTSIGYRAQELDISATTLHRIMTKNCLLMPTIFN